MHLYQFGQTLKISHTYGGPFVFINPITEIIDIHIYGDDISGDGLLHTFDMIASNHPYVIDPMIIDYDMDFNSYYLFTFNELFYIINCISPSPSPTSSPSSTSSPTSSPSTTPSATSSITPSITPTSSISTTPSASASKSITASPSSSSSVSPTLSVTPSITPSPSCTFEQYSCNNGVCSMRLVTNPCISPSSAPSTRPGLTIVRIQTPKRVMRFF